VAEAAAIYQQDVSPPQHQFQNRQRLSLGGQQNGSRRGAMMLRISDRRTVRVEGALRLALVRQRYRSATDDHYRMPKEEMK
jgi:hypothetical protein